MKKKLVLAGIIGVLLVFGMVLVGCDNGTTDDNNTGSITITNQSDYDITFVEIDDATTPNNSDIVWDPDITITRRGGKKTYTVDAPGKYIVIVEDAGYGRTYSSMFSLPAGGSKSLTYNGTLLY